MDITESETQRETINWLLKKANDEIDKACDRGAVWGPSAEAVTVLEQVVAARKYLDQAEAGAVALLREEGATWAQIGTFLGTTRQAAQMRFGKTTTRRLTSNLRACCGHPSHEPGRCEYFTVPRTDFPGSIERCDCDGHSPTARL